MGVSSAWTSCATSCCISLISCEEKWIQQYVYYNVEYLELVPGRQLYQQTWMVIHVAFSHLCHVCLPSLLCPSGSFWTYGQTWHCSMLQTPYCLWSTSSSFALLLGTLTSGEVFLHLLPQGHHKLQTFPTGKVAPIVSNDDVIQK